MPLQPCPRCVESKCTCGGEEPYFYYKDGIIRECACRETRMKIQRINAIYARSGIDKKYRWRFFDSYNSNHKLAADAKNAAYDIVKKFPNVGKGLYLWGNPGTGKTLLSSIILTELIIRHAIEGRFVKISRTFFNRLRATFNESSETYGDAGKIERSFRTSIFSWSMISACSAIRLGSETLYNSGRATRRRSLLSSPRTAIRWNAERFV